MKLFYTILLVVLNNSYLFSVEFPINTEIKSQENLPELYRSGLSFERRTIFQTSSRSMFVPDSIVKLESQSVGRIGSIRMDGLVSLPLLAFDGFVIKDPSINQGQINLDLLPYDFAKSVDIYQQNLAPFGISAGGLIDFRIPLEGKQSVDLTSIASTMGNWYNKFTSEIPFKKGSGFVGLVSDVGFLDYKYGAEGGATQNIYPNSQYQRYSALVKVACSNVDFILANTYTRSNSETGEDTTIELMDLERNALISGLKINQDLFFSSINYTFYNQLVQYEQGVTNEYNNHNLIANIGIKDRKANISYQVFFGYELSLIKDGARASLSNYISTLGNGEHYVNLHTEIEFSNPSKNNDFAIDINLSLNQVVSILSKKYIPIPNFSTVFRHKSGWYSSATISRVFVTPDLTTAYGFGLKNPILSPLVQPKDGVRVGSEFGWNDGFWRIFTKFSYGWLDKGFRLVEEQFIVNSDNVSLWSLVVGLSSKHIFKSPHVMEFSSSLAYNIQKDQDGLNDSLIPIWKWTTEILFRDMLDSWNIKLTYRLEKDVPYGFGFVDSQVRNYIDLHFRYQWFVFNILNIANQSFRPIPENTYSPYNPGARAEIGFHMKL